MQQFIKIHPEDNVAVALCKQPAGAAVDIEGQTLLLREDIPAGHKVALRPIHREEKIIKYGFPIGIATEEIPEGSWVHTHNVRTGLGELLHYEYHPSARPLSPLPVRSFNGYRWADGRAGIRNQIWVVTTVGCINASANEICRRASQTINGRYEGIYTFAHPHGCSQMGQDHINTQKFLAGLVKNPNAGGVLVLGLGCENNNIEHFKEVLGEWDPNRVKFLEAQQVEDEVEEGLKLVEELAEYVSQFKRQPIPVSELVVGLKCGGSDGFSGLTANPLLGRFSDMLVAQGGTTMITEVAEMFGAETILMDRCINRAVFDDVVEMINGYKQYIIDYGQVIYENPSIGNKQGGITTLEDKSLGCTQKGGTAPVSGVIKYGEQVKGRGFHLLSCASNDIVSSTGETVAGAHMVLFSTGRGTPYGAPVPTVKLSTNTPLYEKKKNWIDFDAGRLLQDGMTMDALSEEFFDYIIKLASGEVLARSEINNFREVALFKDGVIL